MGTFKKLLGHVIDLEFTTHEAMIDAALHWQLEEYQLNSGSFVGSMNAIHTEHIQMGNTFRSNGVFIKGKIPKNTYLFAFAESKGKMTHNGLKILEDELVVLNENNQLDFIVSDTVNDITIVIDKDFFDAAFKTYFNVPFQYDTINKRIQLKENTGHNFIVSVRELLTTLMTENTKLQNDSNFHEKTEHSILQIIFQNIDLSRQRQKILESEMNADKIRIHIEMNYKNDICIKELCNINKMSERTLRLSFNHLFGLSPKQYHKCYRLGKIHHDFLQSDYSSIDTVEHIAYDYGFTHMGRFSKNYKAMFGNLPSYTLKKISS